MIEEPLYAKCTIEVGSPVIEINMAHIMKPQRLTSKTRYRAVIEVEFDEWLPEKIKEIMETGVLK